jgi:hypothetical protein
LINGPRQQATRAVDLDLTIFARYHPYLRTMQARTNGSLRRLTGGIICNIFIFKFRLIHRGNRLDDRRHQVFTDVLLQRLRADPQHHVKAFFKGGNTQIPRRTPRRA